jgi:hypothetical protein
VPRKSGRLDGVAGSMVEYVSKLVTIFKDIFVVDKHTGEFRSFTDIVVLISLLLPGSLLSLC